MNPSLDIVDIRRRLATLEREVAEIRTKIGTWESSAVLTDTVSPTVQTPAPAEALEVGPEPILAGEGALPPVLAAAVTAPVSELPPLALEGAAPPVVDTFANETATRVGSRTIPVFPTPDAPTAPETAHTTSWREWLEPLQLWPPSGEADAEVRLAAWWATRIGALLAVIGVVFLGIYVSRDASPWVRLFEVMGVTGLVLGAGAWLERKLPKFGAVVFGAGLALAYFCAFAAYAVPAMKVIASPAVALGCELAVVGGILALAWRRNSPVAASMGVLLGNVTALLALRHGTAGFGPWVVLLLGGVAVLLRLARRWEAPSLVALPLAWIFLAAATTTTAGGMTLQAGWLWCGLYFALFMLRDWSMARRGEALSTLDRVAQVANSTMAVAVGFLVTIVHHAPALTPFFYGSGALLLGATWAWKKVRAEALVPVFVCKALGLIALGVISTFDGQARSLVLLAQAFVVLVSARQAHGRTLRIVAIVTGLVAVAFYVGELSAPRGMALASGALMEVAFVCGIAAFAGALARWFEGERFVSLGGSVLAGLLGAFTLAQWPTQAWAPAANVALAVLLWLAAAVFRAWLGAAIAAAIPAVAAHVALWRFGVAQWGTTALWANEGILLALAAAPIVALTRGEDRDETRTVIGGILAVAGSTLVMACFKAFSPGAAMALTVGISLLMHLTAERARRLPLAALAAPLLALGCALHGAPSGQGGEVWWWVALAAAWVAPVRFGRAPQLLETVREVQWREWTPRLHTFAATIVTWLAIVENMAGPTRWVALVLASAGVVALWRWSQLASGTWAALALLVTAWVSAADFSLYASVAGWGWPLGAAALVALATLGFPLAVDADFAGDGRRRLRWILSGAGLGLAFAALIRHAPIYATAVCGGAAVMTFLLGLVRRSRPHRLVGLGGLAICIVRAFAVDLNSTLHRIVAFVALGLVLLWVGFSYHRFRHLIVDDEKKL